MGNIKIILCFVCDKRRAAEQVIWNNEVWFQCLTCRCDIKVAVWGAL